MFQLTNKLKVIERVKAKCDRHPRYNPEHDGKGGIKGENARHATLSLRPAPGEATLTPHIGDFREERYFDGVFCQPCY